MEKEEILEYTRRFDLAFSLLKRDEEPKHRFIELKEGFLREKQQKYADLILQDGNSDPEVYSTGTLIFYGYRLGVTRLKGKNECYTKQEGYMDNAIRHYNLDEILDVETEEDNPDAGASHIIKWAINPGSNTDVADVVINKMVVPMVKNLCRTTPPGKKTECTVVMPPISKDIEIQDWAAIFDEVKAKELKINIVNYGQLLKLNDNERIYIIQHQSDGSAEFIIEAAYEVIRGHNTCLGCMAFDVGDYDHQYVLQDIKPISLNIDNRVERYVKRPKKKTVVHWDFLDCKYPVNRGFNSFLGNHGASFGREMYKISSFYGDAYDDISEVRAVFHGSEALSVMEVASRLLQEENLYNIPLGDIVYVANILGKKKNGFKTVSIRTGKVYKLGTYKGFDSFVDTYEMNRIPSNYASFSWKVRDKKKNLIPYFKLSKEEHTEKQIIESVVDHFDHCTTETVADDLLCLYKDGEDPSAFFVAKVFMFLSQMESLEIESRNEIVTSIENVDNTEYHEMDMAFIKPSKPFGVKYQADAHIKQERADAKILSLSISDLEFTVRTYNCLKRAGILTVGDIIKRTRSEISRVRNLGRNGQDEVIRKLKELGLTLADG